MSFVNIRHKMSNLKKYALDMSKYYFQVLQERLFYDADVDVYVLMFHCVTNEKKQWDEAEYAITSDTLKTMICTLLERQYVFCRPDDIWEKGRKRIILTFDDAYEGVYTEMFSFLKEMKIPFVIFQAISFLNQPKYLKTEMIQEMLRYDGFVLGAHTSSHCNLHLNNNYRIEIEEPLIFYEKEFGRCPDYIAYPYGAYVTINRKVIKCAEENYKGAFCTCNTGVIHKWGWWRYLIPRMNVNEDNWKTVLARITNRKE